MTSGKDIHDKTAKELGVTRAVAKTVNFGRLYSSNKVPSFDNTKDSLHEEIMKIMSVFPKDGKTITFGELFKRYERVNMTDYKEQYRNQALDDMEVEQELKKAYNITDHLSEKEEIININLLFSNQEIDVLNGAFMESNEWSVEQLKCLLDILNRKSL